MNHHESNQDAYNKLIACAPSELGKYDIAEMNLLCAHGLPGALSLNIPQYLATLDEWTACVLEATNQRFPYYRRNPNPKKGSEAVFRLWAVIYYVKERYDLKHWLLPKKNTGITGFTNKPAFGPNLGYIDSSILFIHGLLRSENRLGSCSSLPVLFVAVARRLGYPVKLALAVQHMFVRWEDAEESFNMEGTGPDSVNQMSYEDYIDVPRKWDTEELTCGCYLKPITPPEELAAFMLMRSACLRYNGRIREALQTCDIACSLCPRHPAYRREQKLLENFLVDTGDLNYLADYRISTFLAGNSSYESTNDLSGLI